MSYDTEIPKGDYDVDTVANPDHDVDTPSGTRYVAPVPLTTADKVALSVAAVGSVLVLAGCFVLMLVY
jgi:hypothetical protein